MRQVAFPMDETPAIPEWRLRSLEVEARGLGISVQQLIRELAEDDFSW